MDIWKSVFLFVLSLLVLSILAASIMLSTKNACFDIGLRVDGFTIHFDPHCGRPTDEPSQVRKASPSRSYGIPARGEST